MVLNLGNFERKHTETWDFWLVPALRWCDPKSKDNESSQDSGGVLGVRKKEVFKKMSRSQFTVLENNTYALKPCTVMNRIIED